MKITREKVTEFLSGRGFYLVLAACLIAVGVTGFIAYLEYTTDQKPVLENGSSEIGLNTSSAEEISSEILAGTDTKEPYSSAERLLEEELVQNIIADSFSYPVNGEIIKDFSADEFLFSATYNDMRIHEALDISCQEGSLISSAGNGVVTAITSDSELGICVEIDHGNGIVAYYCGLNEELYVSQGDVVEEGAEIGIAGEIPGECADPIHLHLEVFKDGKSVDPKTIIE